ncbi:uncharacterized protein LOC106156259 [Lingula anatina]|uniref:Uncharacterized protein LOC106156259 n=1 Tax=Lingula anatina TaxID=7574 RepID=A0A1S3HLJ6_LINAN|nr:uncharacterized protein LOC106156259 [Lingula anatina]|eukprot:XP_013386897.1 uncharacterized protein LOC106156259 [Lingula anatina]
MAKLWASAHGVMNSNETIDVLRKFYLSDGPLTNIQFLPKEMQNFVAERGFPVYRFEKLPADAEFLEEEEPSDKTKRVKRQNGELIDAQCSGGQFAAWKYAYVNKNTCDYLNFCTESCKVLQRTHIRNVMFVSCLCCPYHRRMSECIHCEELTHG